jgi:inhibitor of cysteine peptidase
MKKALITIVAFGLFSCNTQKNIKADYEVNKNETFAISLKSNPTTGYSWKWIKDNASKKVDSVSAAYVQDKAASGMVGVGGNEKWIFKGKEPGIDTLTFEYCRPWDAKSTVETKKFTVKIK